MSDVKRWLGGSPTYMLDVVAAADYDAAQAQADEYRREWESACEREQARFHELADARGIAQACEARAEKAEHRIHLLQQHLDATTADRDRWAARAGEADVERDRLKAMVEVVRALPRVDFDKGGDPYHSDSGMWIDHEDLDRALAEPVAAAPGPTCGHKAQP